MPTYEYECEACGHTMEAFQSITDKPLRKCPECKKLKLRRLISAGAGIIFRGSGFYETDYRSDSYKSEAKKDKTDSSSSSSSKSDSKSESKSESKTESKSKSSDGKD